MNGLRRVVGIVRINISPSNIFLNMLLSGRSYQIYQAAFGCRNNHCANDID